MLKDNSLPLLCYYRVSMTLGLRAIVYYPAIKIPSLGLTAQPPLCLVQAVIAETIKSRKMNPLSHLTAKAPIFARP